MKPIRSSRQALFLAAFLATALLLSACKSSTWSPKTEAEVIADAQALHQNTEVPEGHVFVLVHGQNDERKRSFPIDPIVILLPRRVIYWTNSTEDFIVHDDWKDYLLVEDFYENSKLSALSSNFFDRHRDDRYSVAIEIKRKSAWPSIDADLYTLLWEAVDSEYRGRGNIPKMSPIENIEFNGFKGKYAHHMRTMSPDSGQSTSNEMLTIVAFGAIFENRNYIYKLSYSGPPEVRSDEQIEETLQEALTVLRSIRLLN